MMMNETQMTQQTYNGWANYETWNVALWMQNHPFFYNTAIACVEYHDIESETPYEKFIRSMNNCNVSYTKDGVCWDDENVNHDEINEMMFDYHAEEQV